MIIYYIFHRKVLSIYITS